MRYVITEIEGFALVLPLREKFSSGNDHAGLSVQVIDTAWNHRVVFQRNSEDFSRGRGRSREIAFAMIREQAATRCDLLNRLDEIAREAQGAVA